MVFMLNDEHHKLQPFNQTIWLILCSGHSGMCQKGQTFATLPSVSADQRQNIWIDFPAEC